MFRISQVASRTRWEDVGLPADRLAKLRQVAALRKGAVLFTGASTVDKALAASVLAGTSGRALMRVDLARVVSRYIGETEKNLDRVFAMAAASDAVVFIDEADALFGKRSDVKDSHDRYANLEVGYLLRKIESHWGFVILATKMPPRMDPAVAARLRQVIDFPWHAGHV